MLTPQAPVQQKADPNVQRQSANVQMEEDAGALADSILAAVQTDYKTSPIRQAYEAEVAALKTEAEGLMDGKDKTKDETLADVAQTMNKRRLDIGKKYKDLTILPLRDYIYFANSQRYDTPYGPSYEFLRNKGKTNIQVIEGSSRPNPDINSFLAPFGTWLKAQPVPELKKYQAAVQKSAK